MRVLPILFNTDMVRALLEKRKTVTRRVIKSQPPIDFQYPQADDSDSCWWWTDKDGDDDMMRWWPSYENGLIPPYEPGDILYVRETWAKTLNDNCKGNITGICPYESCENSKGSCFKEEYVYKSSDSLPSGEKWRPSIHMPKEAARIFLRVKRVRAERLQCITRAEALKEGANPACAVMNFKAIWDSTIKTADMDKYGWDANPWVWVIEFERVDKPEVLNG